MSATVSPRDFPEIRWHGHWIWVEPSPPSSSPFAGLGGEQQLPAEAHGLFRKTFALDEVPERAPARITADSRYILYVNGQEAARGPVRSQPRRMCYDLLDLATSPFLLVAFASCLFHHRNRCAIGRLVGLRDVDRDAKRSINERWPTLPTHLRWYSTDWYSICKRSATGSWGADAF